MPTGAAKLENAKLFIDWMMLPENAAAASNYSGYMNAIEGSEDFMYEGLAESPAIDMPPGYADRLRPNEHCSLEARELRHAVWTRLQP